MITQPGEFRFVFTAKDYQAAVAFYRDGLGLPVHHDWDYGPDDKGTVFFAGPALIEIFSHVSGKPYVKPEGVSMSIQVEDADKAFDQALAKGLTVVEVPTTFPWGQRIVRLLDPDGILVSLYAVV